jgi:hypothetical protein
MCGGAAAGNRAAAKKTVLKVGGDDLVGLCGPLGLRSHLGREGNEGVVVANSLEYAFQLKSVTTKKRQRRAQG